MPTSVYVLHPTAAAYNVLEDYAHVRRLWSKAQDEEDGALIELTVLYGDFAPYPMCVHSRGISHIEATPDLMREHHLAKTAEFWTTAKRELEDKPAGFGT